MVVSSEWDQLLRARAALVNTMRTLSAPVTANDVYVSGNCRICRSHLKKTGPICKHCQAVDIFDDYQAKVHSILPVLFSEYWLIAFFVLKLFRRATNLREQAADAVANDDVADTEAHVDLDAEAEQEHTYVKSTTKRRRKFKTKQQ